MNIITVRPFRFLVVATAIGTGIIAIGASMVAIITTLMMYYHLRQTPISPVQPSAPLSPLSLWLMLGMLALMEALLIRWFLKNWAAARTQRKQDALHNRAGFR